MKSYFTLVENIVEKIREIPQMIPFIESLCNIKIDEEVLDEKVTDYDFYAREKDLKKCIT
jgi:hypothetical protein